MKAAVVVFPGSNCDHDALHALGRVLHVPVEEAWHGDSALPKCDLVVLPGGFSYGDYLRCGAIARFSRIMGAVAEHARAGRPVLGICNGFQVLCEAGLLPGALLPNESRHFRCIEVLLRAENRASLFTSAIPDGRLLRMPIAHGDGRYHADAATLDALEEEGRVAFRYVNDAGSATHESNPNGAARNIAGILNERGNVLGMMPHPERAVEKLLGSDDGRLVFESLLAAGGRAA
jgi:phosphoribosylformylglycinamidine synthase